MYPKNLTPGLGGRWERVHLIDSKTDKESKDVNYIKEMDKFNLSYVKHDLKNKSPIIMSQTDDSSVEFGFSETGSDESKIIINKQPVKNKVDLIEHTPKAKQSIKLSEVKKVEKPLKSKQIKQSQGVHSIFGKEISHDTKPHRSKKKLKYKTVPFGFLSDDQINKYLSPNLDESNGLNKVQLEIDLGNNLKEEYDNAYDMQTLSLGDEPSRLIKLPLKLLAILHELLLFCFFVQVLTIMYLSHKIDLHLRLRSPIPDLPSYTATRMPWLPKQLNIKFYLTCVWYSFSIIYLPSIIIYLTFYLDHIINKQRTSRFNLWKARKHDEQSWYLRNHYLHLIETKPRQVLLAVIFLISILLWIFYLVVFFNDCAHPFQIPMWRKSIEDWLYSLQRYYYLEFKELYKWIPEEQRIQAYHTPDDGLDSFLIIDIIQQMFECCGSTNGYVDWSKSHVYRPKNETLRKAMEISVDDLKAYYMIPTLSNQSVPFSCCKWIRTDNGMYLSGCDNVQPNDSSVLYSQGCVEPLLQFITKRWLYVHMCCLACVIITMIPQILLMAGTIQPQVLKHELRNYITTCLINFTYSYKHVVNSGTTMAKSITQMTMKYPVLASKNDQGGPKISNSDEQFKSLYENVTRAEADIYRKNKRKRRRRRKIRRAKGTPTTSAWRTDPWQPPKRPLPKRTTERPPWRIAYKS